MSDTGQLTLRPICPVCKKTQLTDQELARAKDTGTPQRCWYCLVDALVQLQSEESIPHPQEFGRPEETRENGISLAKEKTFRPINVGAALKDMQNSIQDPVAPAPAVGQSPAIPIIKPILQTPPTSLPFTESERKEFAMKFGTDPVPKPAGHEIVVHGAHEDFYLMLHCPTPIDLSYERELKRIMGQLVDITGKLLKYGPNFAATLMELEAMSGAMFIGSK